MKKILIQLSLMIFLLSISISAQSLTVTSGTPVLDGVVSPGEWTSTPLVTGVGVTLNAMADGQYLYLSASWADETESIQKKEWSYDGSAWSQSGNEDRFAFIWDMGLNGSDGANCATMCHDGMATNNGNVDVWHWKAARGNALGFTDDKYFNNILGDDGGRHGDPGTSAYSDNADDGSGLPSFMASGDPGANNSFLAKDAATLAAFDPYNAISPHTYAEAIAFDNGTSFSSGNVIPGYVLRNPAGDRASVQSAGKYESGVWTVEFRRAYTGSDYDFEVVPGSSVEFTHEIFDNTGGGHPNDGYDGTIYTLDFSQIPTEKTSLIVTGGAPVLDGVVSPGEWTSTPLVTGVGVTLNAMADGQYLYLSASWADETESIQKKEWSYDGSAWSQSGNEDRFAFIWDMGLNGSDGANCATMCHDGMATNNGNVDVWHWKAARGNALGFTDDKYFNNILGDDGGRHGDPGTSAYSDNADDGSGLPSFMASGDPGANNSFLAKDAATLAAFDPYNAISPHTYAEAIAFDNGTSFSSGNVIPGYVLRNPAGDRASVQSAGKYESGVWTVEFRRAYTGSDYDFEVVPGSSVEFTHEIFDNTGGGHPNDGYDGTIYTLDFSNVVTDVNDQLFSHIPNTFELHHNYPNPFNPSTIISFSLPKAGNTTLKIYDLLGREITTLVNEFKNAGVYTIEFNARDLTSGIYIYSLQSSDKLMTKKMLLVK